ncbi:hypothetical protein E2542_SST14429 [Spatholobus suberectus]|nr:hypothetical protein E2542_SST14429 [Spatholobus suberectus]
MARIIGEGIVPTGTIANRLRCPWRSPPPPPPPPRRNLSSDLELPLLDFPAAGNGSGSGGEPSIGVR